MSDATDEVGPNAPAEAGAAERGGNPNSDANRVLPAHLVRSFVGVPGDKLAFVRRTLRDRGFTPDSQRALVFVSRRRDAEEFAAEFGVWRADAPEQGYHADYFHAGRDGAEKEEVAERFKQGDISVLFATKAFGMGVDIRNIRYVFHVKPPSSIEDYVQEIGRAGRDGDPAHAFLPYSDADFADVRSRLVKTQLNWMMAREMHALLRDYREKLSAAEQDSFVIPDDLIVVRPALAGNLFGENAATTRQRMLLHCLEEADRLAVGDYETTHWPVTLGPRESDDPTAARIRSIAAGRGATTEVRTLLSERALRQQLALDSDGEAREALFRAAKVGAITIAFDVAVEWTPTFQDEKNRSAARQVVRDAGEFLREVWNADGDEIVLHHALIHPPYLDDKVTTNRRRETDRWGVHLDERKVRLVRFLRRVEGIRVLGDKSARTYRVLMSHKSERWRRADSWAATLRKLPERAAGVIDHLRSSNPTKTVSDLYRAADPGLAGMRLKDLEITLHFLAALGILRVSNDLIPTSMRIEIRSGFGDEFDTKADERVREGLLSRNRLRVCRLDALQVLTRIAPPEEQEAFAYRFFSAASVAEARQFVLEAAGRFDGDLLKQYQAAALDEHYAALTPDEQRRVVRESQTGNLIVEAGPGTGKTHTLITCIAQRLIASDRIEDGQNPQGPIPAGQILALAYTRAVVEELRHRCRQLLRALGRNETPAIHTFHSYALMQLGKHGYRDVPMGDAIARFNEVFAQGLPSAPEHIFVDEFQDITDERADMLKAIRRGNKRALFTVIGDPDQSIFEYDRRARDHASRADAGVYFDSFEHRFAAKKRKLSVNFRCDKAILDHAGQIFPRGLRPRDGAGDGVVRAVSASETTVVEEVRRMLGHTRQVAVLFRTNAELFEALPDLRALPGLRVRVLGGKGRIVYSREINGSLEALSQHHLGEECSEGLIRAVTDGLLKRFPAWERRLMNHLIDGARFYQEHHPAARVAAFVDWVREDPSGEQLLYASRLYGSNAADPELVLATMHRAKGLEFDSVIVAPSETSLQARELEDEKRLRYVAVTRARHYLVLIDGPRESCLAEGRAWRGVKRRGTRFDTVDADGSGAFRLYDFAQPERESYIVDLISEGDPLEIKDNALWHSDTILCRLATGRQNDDFVEARSGIFVAEIVRVDGFGDDDMYRRYYPKAVQERGWYYVVNTAGYLQ